MTFKIINKLKFNNNYFKINNNFKRHVMLYLIKF